MGKHTWNTCREWPQRELLATDSFAAGRVMSLKLDRAKLNPREDALVERNHDSDSSSPLRRKSKRK